jgi:hypothetical protein
MGPQTVMMYYNTEVFEVEASIDDVVFDQSCQTASVCSVDVTHVPSM